MLPEPIFELMGKGVYLYGICIAVGIMACLIVLFCYTKKAGMPEQVQDYTFMVGIIAIAVGFLFAKIFQAFYVWIETGVFDFYGAGITAMGGFVGGAATFIVVYFLAGNLVFKGKKLGLHKSNFNTILRVAPICITIAHAFGRIGCLFAGCCHGNFLGDAPVKGGLYMEGTVNGYTRWGYYVPVQLYEAIFLFLLFAALSVLFFKRSNITMQVYLVAYGIWRMIIEFFRADAARVEDLAQGLTPSQWQSIIFILIAVAMFVFYKVKKIPLILPDDKTGQSKK